MTFSMDTAYELLYPHFQERLHRNEALANHNPLGIGGQADLWVSLASTQELIQLVQAYAEEHFPLLIVGNSSNILFSDSGVEGIVAHIAAQTSTIENLGRDQARLVADAGVNWPHLVYALAKQGWGGLEFGVGIPGTLGGSVVSIGVREEIANAHFGFDIAGTGRIVLNLMTQTVDIDLEHVALTHIFCSPDMLQQEILGENAPGILGQIGQNAIFCG